MKGGKLLRAKGYTIVEVMIVLAVSGVMFVIAAVFIEGKQANAAFREGTNQFADQIQAVINEVGDGKYSDIALDCTVNGSGPVLISEDTEDENVGNATLDSQGTNAPCVFRGKVMHFYKKSLYEVIPLIDSRESVSDTSYSSINSHSILVQKKKIPQSLEVKSMTVIPADGSVLSNPNNNIGIVQSGSNFGSVGQIKSGAQTFYLVYISGVSSSNQVTANGINGKIGLANKASICITDGARYAVISLGESGKSKLQATVQMKGSTPC